MGSSLLGNAARQAADRASVEAFYDSAFTDGAPDDAVAADSDNPWSTDFPVPKVAFPSHDDSLRTLAWRPPRAAPSWIPRPSLVVRSMWLVLIVTLMVLTIFAGLLAHLIAGITHNVREQVLPPAQVVGEPLPSASVLRDADQFAEVVAQRPQRRVILELARLEALLEAGELWTARELANDLALPYRRRHLLPDQRVALAEFQAQLGNRESARQLIAEADLSHWPAILRQRAVALVGRLHMSQREPAHRRSLGDESTR